MNNKLYSILLTSLLGLSALISALFFLGAVSEGILIALCYALFGIASITAIAFPIIFMAQNPKGAKNALFGVIALLLIFGIAYALSSSEEFFTINGVQLANATASKYSEAGLIAFYIIGSGAILAVIYAEVSKLFK